MFSFRRWRLIYWHFTSNSCTLCLITKLKCLSSLSSLCVSDHLSLYDVQLHSGLSERSYHSNLISSHLTSSQLTPFHRNWVVVSALWACEAIQFAVASTSQTRKLWPTSFWLVAATANWVASQRTHCHSLMMEWGQLRWDEMRWVIWTLLYAFSVFDVVLYISKVNTQAGGQKCVIKTAAVQAVGCCMAFFHNFSSKLLLEIS